MSEISSITDPIGNVYQIKDTNARDSLDLCSYSKTYNVEGRGNLQLLFPKNCQAVIFSSGPDKNVKGLIAFVNVTSAGTCTISTVNVPSSLTFDKGLRQDVIKIENNSSYECYVFVLSFSKVIPNHIELFGDWVRGGINTVTGIVTTTGNNIRRDNAFGFSDGYTSVYLTDPDMAMSICAFQNGEYVGAYFRDGTFKKKTGASFMDSFDLTLYPDYDFLFILYNRDYSQVSLDQGVNFVANKE